MLLLHFGTVMLLVFTHTMLKPVKMCRILKTTIQHFFEVQPISKFAIHSSNCFFFYVGIQLTNASGVATFDTIYPGWYVGRATHMHIKVHLGGTYISSSSYYSGATYVHTGQLFFNDSLSDLVNQQSPYNTKTTSGSRLQNSADNIYQSGGSYTLMNVQYVNSDNGLSDGMITSVALYVESTTSDGTSTTSGSSDSTSTTPSNGAGTRVGGRPFWLW